eukprot:14635-Pelagococcus_subviridis.AAC.1
MTERAFDLGGIEVDGLPRPRARRPPPRPRGRVLRRVVIVVIVDLIRRSQVDRLVRERVQEDAVVVCRGGVERRQVELKGAEDGA